MIKKTALFACVSALLMILPARAGAQSASPFITKPPCARGTIYVGGSSRKEAYCVDRRYQKMQKAQHWQERSASRNLLRQETRRTTTERTRTVYLHQNLRRKQESGGFSPEEARARKHDMPMTEFQLNLRYLRRGKRGQPPAETRQDRSPFTRWTRRSKTDALQKTLRGRVDERLLYREQALQQSKTNESSGQ